MKYDYIIVGAGTVGRNLFAAYSSAFPEARFTVWNRTTKNAEAMVADMCRKLLSNPVIEEFSFELHESPSASCPSSS